MVQQFLNLSRAKGVYSLSSPPAIATIGTHSRDRSDRLRSAAIVLNLNLIVPKAQVADRPDLDDRRRSLRVFAEGLAVSLDHE
jgi:hypothetical protein